MTDTTPPAPTPAPTQPAGWYPDAASGQQRWWDGTAWTENFAPAATTQVTIVKNGFATAALILGIAGFVLMGIPLFIGWFTGGPLDILAVIFGILGIRRASELGGVGKVASIWGLVLASVSLISVFFGAGSIW